MNTDMIPNSIEELKGFVKQFEMIIPEEKRVVIYNTIEQVEASGGIQDDVQAQTILMNLLQGLGL